MLTTGPHAATAPPHHPPPVRLAAFGLGRVDDDESSTIADHISACDACRMLVEAVADDSLAGMLRRAEGPDRESPGAEPPSGYEILEVVGRGGMGVVSKARQVGLGRIVALKQVRPEVLAGDDGVARFRREAAAAARLRHPNIVPIYDVGRHDGLPYYSMEYVEGGTLADRLREGPLAPKVAARLVETLSGAVRHAHEAGVVHRDLKPGNVLLAPDLDCPKICDFGLAKRDDDASTTRSGVLLGTPSYMAPEQAEGDSSRVGPPADVYALGAILYECLTGRPPFRASTTLEILELVRKAEPTPPRRIEAGIPRDLETIALKCLAKSPARRYESAGALASDLRRFLEGEPIAARPASTPERLARWAARRPWQATSAALGALILAGAMAGTLVHNSRLRAEVARTAAKAEEVRAQKVRAEDQYRSARDAIRRMIGRLDEPRFAVAGLGLRRRLLEDALAFYEGAVRDDATVEPASRLDKARALEEAGHFQVMIGDHGPASKTFRRALAVLDSLDTEGLDVGGERISVLSKLGLALSGSGRGDEATAVYAEAIDRLGRPAAVPARGDQLAWCHHNLGHALYVAGRVGEAVPHFREAATIRRGLIGSGLGDDDLRSRLAESLIDLGLSDSQTGRIDRAEAGYAEADAILGPIVRDRPDRQDRALSMGKLALNWGTLLLTTGRPGPALDRYEAGRGPVAALLKATPDWPEPRRIARQLDASIGQALGRLGRSLESAEAWGRAAESAEGEERRGFRLMRAGALAPRDAAGALAEADAILADPAPPSGVDLYNLACVAALASVTFERAGSTGEAGLAADRALRWLALARDAGQFRDPGMVAFLDGDHDLDPLRTRPEFRLFRLDLAFPSDPFRPGP